MSIVTKEGSSRSPGGNEQPSLATLSELPPKQLWHSSAPSEVRSGVGSSTDAWSAFADQVKSRDAAGRAKVGTLATVAWGLATDSPVAARLERIGKGFAGKDKKLAFSSEAEAWLEEVASEGESSSVALAIQSVGWAYAMPAAASLLSEGLWWRVLEQLGALVEHARDASPGEPVGADESLVDQLLACEAPLVLSALLPEIAPLRALRKQAVASLTEGVLALTDGEGLPPARCLAQLPLLVACWTRCRSISEHTGKKCWDASAETQYEWLVRQCLRLARPDGSFVLSSTATGCLPMMLEALQLAGDESDEAAAVVRLRPKPKLEADAELPDPAVNSEWSSIAVLSAGWKPKAPRLAVSYEGTDLRVELMSSGQLLFSGDWPVDVKVEGAPLAPIDDWEEQCWFSDDESDYLELSIDLEQGVRLERQFFLTRDHGVGYLSEIVLTDREEAGAIEVTTLLPLASGVKFKPEKETREGWLAVGKTRLAGAVPLALPEWRDDPRHGELTMVDDRLCLSQTAIARNLCVPLMFDFKTSRFAKQRTWRQLTVAEQLEKVHPDVAVGYRMQSGKDQWVVYRSLDDAANRTIIGGNYASESFIGRFLPTGEIEEYWEVEDD